MEMRLLYRPLQLFLVVFLALWINSTSGQTPPPDYLPQLALLQGTTINNTPKKIQVRVVPVDIVQRDYVICVGYQLGPTVTLTKYVFSALTSTVYNTTDLSVAGTFSDFYIMSPGTPSCTVVYLTTLSTLKYCSHSNLGGVKCGLDVPLISDTGLYVAQVNLAAGVSDSFVFYTNGTDAFSGDGSQGKLPPPIQFNSLTADLWGTSNYIAALERINGGLIAPGIYEKNLGTWTSPTASKPARAPSVAGWVNTNQWVVCFDTGTSSPTDSLIYCRAKGQAETTIDDGPGANAFFDKTMVSAVNDDYGIVSTVAWANSFSKMRIYTIRRDDGSLVQGSIWLDSRQANYVATHSAGNLVAIAQFSSVASNMQLFAHDFKPSLLPSSTPQAAPVAPPTVAPSTAPVSKAPTAPSAPTTPLAPTSPSSPTAVPGSQAPQDQQIPQAVPVDDGGVSKTPTDQSLSVGIQAAIGVSVSAGVAGTGLFVLLFMLKKKRDAKKNQANETPMDPADGTQDAGSDGTYGNLPGTDNGKYSNINLGGNDKYGSVNTTVADDGIAVPTSIQPSEIDKRMHIPYKSLVFVKEIGAGSYGKVYLGEWRGAKVAIKVNNTVTDVDGFLAEAKLTLGITPHPNLVQTFGVSLDGPNPCIVLEYCGGGSLDQLFSGDKGLTNEKRVEYALKVGYGLLHLHSRSIVHRDLAARNILLTNDGQPKISDFGMSRIVQEEAAKGKTKTNFGPIRWMAPECLKDKSYSLKSDVWSFGIILYELVAGKEPHENEDQLEIALKIRDKGKTPEIPDDCDPVLRECMEMCWKFSPNDRPTMEDVCDFLRSKTDLSL